MGLQTLKSGLLNLGFYNSKPELIKVWISNIRISNEFKSGNSWTGLNTGHL